MPPATRSSTATRPADRLPRSGAPAARGREIRLGIAGVLGLLVLVAGIPVALGIFVGYPLPRTTPSHDWLTTSISATLIINVLACVVWVVWAHFVICLLTEWRAVRRGRVPSRVALGGGSQLLARRLVAAALLLAGTATVFGHSAAGPAARPPAAVSTQHIAAPAASRTDSVAEPKHETTEASKYYIVQPPDGRRYDSLWDIAHRTLHDPLRYKEIFALNKDRIQSDGSKLSDANLIMPGWHLRLPSDASGPGVHVTPVAKPAAKPATPRTAGEHEPAAATTSTAAHNGTGAQVAPPVSSADATGSSDDQSQLTSTLFGGGLILAGLLTALTARRGPYATPDENEDALGSAADPGLAGLLDKALRHLALARAQQRRTLPHPVVAWASHERIILNLGGGDTAEPPAPWRPGESDRTWDLETAMLPDGPAPDVPAPFPGLLSIGRSDDYDLFLDVEQAPGVISIVGDLERGRELATALAVQAATCRWSDGAKVTAVGFGGEELVQIAPRSIVHVPRLADVLTRLEEEHARVVGLQRQLGVDGVLTGRQVYRSGAWVPQLVLLSGPPTPDEAARLQALSYGRSETAVLVLGDVPAAPWRFVIGPGGELDLGPLGVSATAHRITHSAAVELVQMLSRADAERPRTGDEVRELQPAAALASRPHPMPSNTTPAVVAISLLGPIVVTARGPMDPGRHALATEIVVAAALHPDGLHDAVLRSSVWPRGVDDDVVAAAMDGVRAWLGPDESGRPCLEQHPDGSWRLSAAVRCDWVDVQALAAAAAGEHELAMLRQAVALFRGEAFSGTTAGRYGWLAFARAAREARVLGSAVTRRAAALLVEQRRIGEAEQTLRQGLGLVPTAELLWRDLLSLRSWDGPGSAAAAADEMYAVLRAHRVWAEPQTEALVAQVAPGYGGLGPHPAAPAVAAG